MKNKPFNQKFFNDIAVEFDNHVRQSIPLFNEAVLDIQKWIVSRNELKNIVDICGSTGLMGFTLLEQGYKGLYHNIDGSPKMIEIANGLASKYPSQMFNYLAGYKSSWVDDSGIEIQEKQLTSILGIDLTLEILGFQFFSSHRQNFVIDIANNSTSAIFLEKFITPDWDKNEVLKDTLHKSKSFTESELQDKRDTVLTPMGEYLYDLEAFEDLLRLYFKHVEMIYKAGNFAGFFATNSPTQIEYTSSNSNLLNNKFNA